MCLRNWWWGEGVSPRQCCHKTRIMGIGTSFFVQQSCATEYIGRKHWPLFSPTMCIHSTYQHCEYLLTVGICQLSSCLFLYSVYLKWMLSSAVESLDVGLLGRQEQNATLYFDLDTSENFWPIHTNKLYITQGISCWTDKNYAIKVYKLLFYLITG